MRHMSDEALEPTQARLARTEARLARMHATRHDWARRVAEGRDDERRRVEAAHLAGLDQPIGENGRLLAFARTLSDPRQDTECAVDGRGFEVGVVSSRDERRAIAGRLSLAGEVAARRRAEAALHANEARFHEIADSLPAFIFLLGPD